MYNKQKNIIMGYVFLVALILGIVGGIISAIQNSKMSDKKVEEYDKWLDELNTKYGEVTLAINNAGTTSGYRKDKQNSILVFDNQSIIIINGVTYEYNEILDFDINNQMSYKTSTSAESMLGRAVVGGVLTGGVGAVIGGATAKKETKGIIEEYKVNISVRRMSAPLITVITKDVSVVNTLSAVLKNIIDSNK